MTSLRLILRSVAAGLEEAWAAWAVWRLGVGK